MDELTPQDDWTLGEAPRGTGPPLGPMVQQNALWAGWSCCAVDPKPDGGTRVLSIGETLIRSFLRTVAFALNDKGAEVLAPHQYSVGVRGGVDEIAQAVELL